MYRKNQIFITTDWSWWIVYASVLPWRMCLKMELALPRPVCASRLGDALSTLTSLSVNVTCTHEPCENRNWLPPNLDNNLLMKKMEIMVECPWVCTCTGALWCTVFMLKERN